MPDKATRREFLRSATVAAGTIAAAGCAGTRERREDNGETIEEIGIWDLHGHLTGIPGRTPQDRMRELVDAMDRVGVERLMMFMGMRFDLDPTPAVLRKQNDEVLQAIESQPDRTFGFVYLNPKHTDVSLKELDRCVRDGPMVGVKLWTAVRCSAPELDPLIRRAAELKAVIFQHTWLKVTGNYAGESTPSDVVELARRHPDVPLICGHTGGDWERGVRTVRASRNVSVGLSGFDPCSGVVEMGVRELGAERLIFGSDVGGRSFASQMAKAVGADIPYESKRLILRENLRGMLQPILKAKGIRA